MQGENGRINFSKPHKCHQCGKIVKWKPVKNKSYGYHLIRVEAENDTIPHINCGPRVKIYTKEEIAAL